MKLLCKEVKERYIVIGSIVFMILLFIPVVLLAKYMVPSADDYSYGLDSHMAYLSTGSVIEVIKSAYNTVLIKWYTWQGTFSSIFLMSLTPAVFSDKNYGVATIFLLTTLVFAIIYSSKVFFKDVIKVQDCSWLAIGCLVSIFCVETFLSKVEALYWYNSGVHYTFMTACMFMMLSTTVKAITEKSLYKNIIYLILSSIFAFIVSGGNYINALLGAILFVTIICVALLYKNKKMWLAIFPVVFYSIGFYISISAPGNAVRQAYFEKLSVFDTIKNSFMASFSYELEWCSIFTLLYMILMLPIFWNNAQKSKFTFKFPLVVPVYCLCLVASSFAPSFYSMGISGGGRTLNVSKMIFQICLFVCEWYFCGYFNLFLEKKKMNFHIKNTIIHYVVILGLFVALIFVQDKDYRIQNYATYGSCYYISSGEAESYYASHRMRLPYFKLGDKNVVVDKYPVRPSYLYFDDITTDANDWKNRGMAMWYGVESVVLSENY